MAAAVPTIQNFSTVILGEHHYLDDNARFLCDHLDILFALDYRHIGLELPQDAEKCTEEDYQIAKSLFSILGEEEYTKIHTACFDKLRHDGRYASMTLFKEKIISSTEPRLIETIKLLASNPELSRIAYENFMSYRNLRYQLHLIRLGRAKGFEITLLGVGEKEMKCSIDKRIRITQWNLERLVDADLPGKKIISTGAWHAAKFIGKEGVTPCIFPRVYDELKSVLDVGSLLKFSVHQLLLELHFSISTDAHPPLGPFLSHKERKLLKKGLDDARREDLRMFEVD